MPSAMLVFAVAPAKFADEWCQPSNPPGIAFIGLNGTSFPDEFIPLFISTLNVLLPSSVVILSKSNLELSTAFWL